ncbi:response regulator transcription factor [Corynebacterium sp. 153RC1]|uniref:response regulator transcription factor n=1 Tax=unclassified Corynebacterium TaxID=2624378 RepID=UPI00211BC636|nr:MULTISPECIES: response regulator transcription factor [unclassified Corynebacterium]MCQ9351995.1 response regulator transcription factor [Corynebacterium sp. 209RC1]MCQ9353744.1 response regulator transcription factor [Corynebacterium sp. 1222RC1]MCQ9356272.1 response regulator transcription factor [Corynebacterium sp. 122RC1]MCQ9358374.1 response regulator transcription factor [Corynebacterium sp. 142RC1]MCQ9360891.1 response regulator transcription factor [Corynebacterium sp. 153RC1]
MSRILIAEDDAGIAEFIARGLEAEGYSVDLAPSGPIALGLAHSGAYQLMVLDLGLPGLDGTEVLGQLRSLGNELPIIVLTARTGLDDRIKALEGGANDYMPKPFQFAELLARVRLRLRDTPTPTGANTLSRGGITLDLKTHRVEVDGKWVDLSRRELGLLETLMRHPGHILSRAQLLGQVWGMDFDPGSNVVDVYIRTLRKKIGADRVETVRGSGYRFKD